jgi:hypothetical protein
MWSRFTSLDNHRSPALRLYHSYCNIYQCRFEWALARFDQVEPGGPHATPTYNLRVDGLEMLKSPWVLNGRHAFVCNSRLTGEPPPTEDRPDVIRCEGLSEQLQVKNCTLSAPAANTYGSVAFESPVSPVRAIQVALANNVIVVDTSPTQPDQRFLGDRNTSGQVLRSASSNVWRPDKSGQPRFTLCLTTSTDMTFAQWQALSICTGEATQACTSADFDPAQSYLPAASLTVVRSNGQSTPGVFRDYRGVLRSIAPGTTWFAGCTSAD